MASTPFSKLAYTTLQQGKAIAGLAHKELSTKLMELLAPEDVPSTENVPPELLKDLRITYALKLQGLLTQLKKIESGLPTTKAKNRLCK